MFERETVKLAIYGKGGIGKSTISANLSMQFALRGGKVLHVGCDPKSDSTILLTHGERPVTVASKLIEIQDGELHLNQFIRKGAADIDCIEAGGPEPGLGCGGWGVARVLSMLEENDYQRNGYKAIVFDILGDVVCGGFAAPLRKGFADMVVLVISEEVMSLFAANNIARAIVRLQRSGIRLAGIVVNRRDNSVPVSLPERFAEQLGAPILAVMPRDPLIGEAEIHGQTVSEYAPQSEASKRFEALSQQLERLPDKDLVLPTPLDDEAFFSFIQTQRGSSL